MTDLRKAAEMALEALEKATPVNPDDSIQQADAIVALRTALTKARGTE